MHDWTTMALKDFVDINPKEKIVRGETVKRVTMDKLRAHNRDIQGYDAVEYDEGVKFRNGDTLMARITPSLENGKTALAGILEENEVAVGSSEFIVLRPKQGVSDSDFIYYLCKSPYVRNAAIKSMAGSTGRQRVQLDVLMNLEIKVPPLEKQKEIGKILRFLDDKIYVNEEINQRLYQEAEMLFQAFFVSFKQFRLNGMKESEVGAVPEKWDVLELGEIADIQTGYAFKSKDYCENGYRIVRITNIQDGYINNESAVKVSPDFFQNPNFGKYQVNLFDTLLVMVGTNIGKIGLATERNMPSLVNQNLWRFRAKKDVSPIFIHFLTCKINERVHGCSSGSAREFYRKELFRKAKCICPPLEVFQDFDNLCMPLFMQISVNLHENEKLGRIRDSLLPKLLAGEVRTAFRLEI